MARSSTNELAVSNAEQRGRGYAHRLRLPGIPVFNYHGLADVLTDAMPEGSRPFWLSPAQFRSHLATIQASGFRVAQLDELQNSGDPRVSGQPRATVLSFDDGLASDYSCAFPLLQEFGATAVFFVNSSNIGQQGYLTWSQLAEMSAAGMSIQSHSHRHMDLTVLPEAVLKSELLTSRRQIEDHVGCRVRFLAAPHGILNRRVVDQALALGYEAVCSTRCLPARPGAKTITRITLRREMNLDCFHGLLSGAALSYARRLSRGLVLRPLGMAGHLVGIVRYRWLRQAARVSK